MFESNKSQEKAPIERVHFLARMKYGGRVEVALPLPGGRGPARGQEVKKTLLGCKRRTTCGQFPDQCVAKDLHEHACRHFSGPSTPTPDCILKY